LRSTVYRVWSIDRICAGGRVRIGRIHVGKEFGLLEPLEGLVQRAGTEADPALAVPFHFLLDALALSIAIRQRQRNRGESETGIARGQPYGFRCIGTGEHVAAVSDLTEQPVTIQ
jgi:hypothetical protein